MAKPATAGGGDVELLQYGSLKVEIPLYEPPQEFTREACSSSVARSVKRALLESYTAEKPDHDVIQALMKKQRDAIGSEEVKQSARRGSRSLPLPDAPVVILEPLTRAMLNEKKWLALIGLPGLKKLRLTLISEMHVLLPIQVQAERV